MLATFQSSANLGSLTPGRGVGGGREGPCTWSGGTGLVAAVGFVGVT